MLLISKKRKIDFAVFFSTFLDFLDFIKKEYDKINYNNTEILNMLESCYNELSISKDVIYMSALKPYVVKHLNSLFKYKNSIFKTKYWLERGFNEKEANNKINNYRNKSKEYSVYCIEYYIKKGYSKKEAKEKISNIQRKNSLNVKNRFIKSKENLKNNGFNNKQIKDICSTPANIEFWIKKGYNKKEAEKKVKKHQSNAAKFVDFEKRLIPSNLEYWIKKGYNKKEAKNKVKECQTTFSKDICIKKYGYDKGIEIFNKRTAKWIKSLNENGNMKIGYSKISQELFDEISNRLNGDFMYATYNEEFKLEKNDGGFWLYDFVDVKRKKIIEYQGDMFHGNPKTYEANDNPHPFRKNITALDMWNKDEIKRSVAENNGYDVLYIWDSEFRSVSKNRKNKIIQKCIDFVLK